MRFFAMLCAAACATTRSPAKYREDTHVLLYKNNTSLVRCYEKALVTNPDASGRVTIRFVVERKTGQIVKPTIDSERSNASQELLFCVLDAVANLRLEPPDANEGRATFVYEFTRAPR